MATRLVTARVWADAGFGQAPEQCPGVLSEPPARTAVCFSGGGTRSMVASIGQLRALQALGLLDRVGYLSCVSGSAWAAVPFVFAPDGLARLGTPTAPEALTRSALDTVPDYDDHVFCVSCRRVPFSAVSHSDWSWPPRQPRR